MNPTTTQAQRVTRNVKHYECKKGVKRVKGLQKHEIEEGKNLGVLPCSMTVLLTEKHVEITVILDTKGISRGKAGSSRWFGFYFCGTIKNLEKCFQKKYHNLELICQLLDSNFASENPDPYFCPLLVIGEMGGPSSGEGSSSSAHQAFWQVRSEDQSKIIGFVPLLHRTDAFHTISDFPLIAFEERHNPNEPPSGPLFTLTTTIDRNHLIDDRSLPNHIEIDKWYTEALYAVNACFRQEQKFKLMLVRQRNDSHNVVTPVNVNKEGIVKEVIKVMQQHNQPKEKEGETGGNEFTILRDVKFCKKGLFKNVDLLSLEVSPNGRTHFVEVVQLFLTNPRESTISKEHFDKMSTNVKHLQYCCSKGVTIYNPFLAKEAERVLASGAENQQITPAKQAKKPAASPAVTAAEVHPTLIERQPNVVTDTATHNNVENSGTSLLPHLMGLLQPNANTNVNVTPVTGTTKSYSSLPPDPSILKTGTPVTIPFNTTGGPSNPSTPTAVNNNPISVLDQLQQLGIGQQSQQQPVNHHLNNNNVDKKGPTVHNNVGVDPHRLAAAIARAFMLATSPNM